MACLLLALLLLSVAGQDTYASQGADDDGRGDSTFSPCHREPPGCQDEGLSLIPLGEPLLYQLEGWWELHGYSGFRSVRTLKTRRASVSGLTILTHVSPCTLKVTLTNVSFSDWPQENDRGETETWVRVKGGEVEGVCGRLPVVSQRDAHLHALARSLASAAINSVPDLGSSSATVTESDYMGQCSTQYQLGRVWPAGHEVIKMRDLVDCTHTKAHSPLLSSLNTNATWSCRQMYSVESKGVGQQEGWLTLHSLSCHEELTLIDAATTLSSLTLTPLHTSHPSTTTWEEEVEGLLQPLELDLAAGTSPSLQDQNVQIYDTLAELCTHLEARVTADTTILYPRLLSVLTYLPKEMLVQLYHEVSAGRICPQHQRLRGLFSAALRDTTTPAAAAAKCQLMTSRTAEFSRSWTASLASVKKPTAEALLSCAELLSGGQWEGAVLGVAAMGGWAAKVACGTNRPLHPCHLNPLQCPQGPVGEICQVGEAVNVVVSHLSGWLARCSSRQDQHQVLLALRGLSNVGGYGPGVEAGLRQCGGAELGVSSAVRVAAVATLGRGPCSLQVQNWLKWEVLNETNEVEIRITAFQSLRRCNPDEAEAVATLVTQRQSHTQVKSYLNDFVNEERNGGNGEGHSRAERDARQFSRHLLANLTTLLGLPDSTLEADLVFQNSFLPRSLALNLSSPLLSLFGGSAQAGIRLENMEDLLQSIVGPGGMAGDGVGAWVARLVARARELFTSVTREFVESHGREKRSYNPTDVAHLLAKVRNEVVTELRGWVWAGLADQDGFFSSFSVDPLALDVHDMIAGWLEQILDSTYSALINSDMEVTSGWSVIDDRVRVWGLVGVPVVVWRRVGGLATIAATSQVNLLNFITNPTASTINIGMKLSGGVYRQMGLSVERLPGPVSASTTTQDNASGDVKAELVIQGGDQMELKVDLPQASLLNTWTIHTLEVPPGYSAVHDDEMDNYQLSQPVMVEDQCGTDFSDDPEYSSLGDSDRNVQVIRTALTCNEAFESRLGLRLSISKWVVAGHHTVGWGTQQRMSKSHGIQWYRLAMSWKNPGVNSLFLDMQFEAEEDGTERRAGSERKAGLVFGLTYSPHFTFKVQLHSHQFSAFAEASLVNDPNLKRVEAHLGYLNVLYGLKAELLMVQDGGHVTMKPRLVLAYPGQQEDALVEGYLARYHSDKVSSITLDLYTEGSLKQLLDLAIKGTAEMRTTLAGATVVTLKNLHLATPTTTLGLEAAFSLESDGVECKVQVTWGGEVVVLDGRVSTDESEYQVSLEVLLPSHPHLNTHLLYIISSLPSQVSNNLTLMVGPESTRSEFQVTHSTVWHIADMDDLTSNIMTTQSRQLSFIMDNKLSITSEAAAIDWQFDHSLEVNNQALENLVTVRLADTSYIISTNFYDQSEALLKYHTELKLSLGPQWHFSYSDTLEQVREGEWVGRSYAQMPSSRQYTTTSTLSRKSLGSDGFLVESRQEMQVEDTEGGQSWSIIGEESFTWTTSNMSLEANLSVEDVNIFSVEAYLEGTSSSQLDLHLKSRLHNLFECQVVLGSKGLATDLSFMLLIIPLNKEIRSTVAVGQRGHCSGGTMDEQVVWGARGDLTHTLALSSSLHLPQDSHPLQLRGSMSLLGVAWDARLEAVLGEVLEDTHRFTFTFILPDQSKFEMESQLAVFMDENELTLLAGFHLHLPAGEKHNVTLEASCIDQEDLTDAKLKLHIDSPFSQEVIFQTQVKNQMTNEHRIINFTLQTHSEANYWQPIKGGATGWWNSSKAETEAEVHWGNFTLEMEGSGWHRVVGGEHQVEIEGEVRRPMATTWRQLKSSLCGSFSIAHNPAKLEVTQEIYVEKDEEEVFQSSGEVKVSVPQVEGRLSITHSGAVAATHDYKMDGKFTGREMEVRVVGSIDGEPIRMTVHYEDGRQARVQASYRSPQYFTLAFTTHLTDISIGYRKGGGTTYSLNTEGELVYHGHSTKMLHQLSISRNQASSNITLDPFLGSVCKLSMTRTKLDLNEWETDVELSWGERVFSYQDKVRFPSLSDFSVQVQIDAPEFYLHQILALVEAGVEAEVGQGFKIMLRQQNITMHNARMIFYNYEAGEEHVWEAGVHDVIVYSHAYRDLRLYYTFIPLVAGLEVKSNMTLGDTPVVAVGVKVVEHTRELLLGFCTTSDECVQLHVHTHAQDTHSTRNFTLDAHALNSLFWKSPEDPLIQNSILLVAQHTPDRTMVSGGLWRVECAEVNCFSSIPQNMLHATLLLTHDTLDLTVNTTKRTIMMTSKVRENQEGELLPTSLPGGRLTNTATLESCLWLDKERDPQGAITWTSNMAAYTSARATERVFRSSLTHPSIAKPLVVEGRVQAVPSLTSATLVLDVFSQPRDSLVLHLDLKQDGAQYLLSANLSKSAGSREHVMGAVMTLLPSPDNGEVSVALLLPPYTPTHSLSDLRFTFHCKMITKLANKTLSCKARTATLNEEVSMGYHRGEGGNCLCGGVWLALLNRTFTLRHRSCHDLPSSQTALTRKAEGDSKKELALKFGLVDPLYAELELLGLAGVNIQLHPPFLLHATAHHTRSLGAQWHHVLLKAEEEMNSLTTRAKTVFQAVVADAEKVKGFSSVSSLTPATSLARYLRHHASNLTLEAKQDQLMLDVVYGAQACMDITSVLLEGAVTYVSHNYGPALGLFMEGAQVLMESAVMNTGAAIAQLNARLYRTTISTLNIIADLPATIFSYALSLPIVSQTHEWISAQLQFLQRSAAFTLLRNTTMKALKFLQVVLALIYKEGGDLKHRVKSEEVWNIWVPLTECSHSLPEVWQTVRGTARFTPHSHSLASTLLHWWHLLKHPLYLINNIIPPFPAEGAIIGDKNFVSVDGRTFSLAPASDCSHVLLTDARDRLFTLLASWDETRAGTNYTLLLVNTTVRIQADFQVTINSAPISLPYSSDTVTVTRDDRKVSVAAHDSLGREVVSVVCWMGARRTCVVGISGWLHGDTRALLGSLNLDPANDFMRPSGKVTQSKAVFKKTWQVGSGCVETEGTQPDPHPSPRSIQLCKRFLLHYTSPVFACHETLNIRPYYDTCLRYLSSLDSSGERTEQSSTASNVDTEHSESITSRYPMPTSVSAAWNSDKEDIDALDKNGTVYEVSIQDVLLKLTEPRDVLADLSSSEGAALCDVAAAYSTICARRQIIVPLPPLCEEGVVPSYHEPLSPEPQLDVVVVMSEDTCDTFTYHHLARPLPQVLNRVALAKNISDIRVGVLGYGSGGGDVVYRSRGNSLLTPASQLRITQPPETQRSHGSILQAMRAVSSFPFRPGSVRVALLLRCDARDIPKFTETLPREMVRRRLALFTLTPDTLMFNPSRPKAVRNTIGIDRWRVYNLKLDRTRSSDSWGVKRPSSNIAQLAMKSGGGVFSLSGIRRDPRARYYMKLFRRVLSKAITKVVLSTYRQLQQHQ